MLLKIIKRVQNMVGTPATIQSKLDIPNRTKKSKGNSTAKKSKAAACTCGNAAKVTALEAEIVSLRKQLHLVIERSGNTKTAATVRPLGAQSEANAGTEGRRETSTSSTPIGSSVGYDAEDQEQLERQKRRSEDRKRRRTKRKLRQAIKRTAIFAGFMFLFVLLIGVLFSLSSSPGGSSSRGDIEEVVIDIETVEY